MARNLSVIIFLLSITNPQMYDKKLILSLHENEKNFFY